MEKAGFIGLGIMGAPMAAHLRAAGFALFVHTRSAAPAALIAAGAVNCGSAKEVAAILKACNEARVGVVPQAGNTGLVGGQIPHETGTEIVLSVARLIEAACGGWQTPAIILPSGSVDPL